MKRNHPYASPYFDPICLAISTSLTDLFQFQRRFFPHDIAKLSNDLFPSKESLISEIQKLNEVSISSDQNKTKRTIHNSSNLIIETFEMILSASTTDLQSTIIQVMKAFRNICRAQEMLYPIRHVSLHLNQFFLEPFAHGHANTFDGKPGESPQTGLIRKGVDNDDYARGAVSLYIPESYTGTTPWPLVVALHGGFGHGRDFIWTWLREARSRNFLLLCPTSLDTTWSLLNPKFDGATIDKTLHYIQENWNVDSHRILLTGISDGGTFALISGMQKDSPFTAFAPIACTLPPMDISHAKNRRILWIHGALDWMFPIHTAQGACELLRNAGADVSFHAVDNLSHTYPRDENDRILSWFDSSLARPV